MRYNYNYNNNNNNNNNDNNNNNNNNNIADKEKEKIQKYQDIRREIARLWNIKTYVVPVVIGSLGMVTKNLAKYLGKIGIPTKIELLQKAALLGSARLLRNVLEA